MPRKNAEANTQDAALSESADSERVAYELGMLLAPTIAEEDVAGVVTAIKDVLERHGASGLSDSVPVKKPLAYGMRHETPGTRVRVNQGYFDWVKFECAASRIEALAQELKTDERIVRFLFVHAPKEVVALPPKRLRSSVLLRRPLTETLAPATAGGVPGEPTAAATPPAPAMTDEELDRTIAELIIE